MSRMDDAKSILRSIGMPVKQQNDMCCYVLLAMTSISENKLWKEAESTWIRIHDIISFTAENYGVTYAENSRETFRKQAIHHFRNAAIIEDNGMATNSPNYRYRITPEALALFRAFGLPSWDSQLEAFLSTHTMLIDMYASKKRITKMPVTINGADYTFSIGSHNELQRAIVEEFAPRFAGSSNCLYVGDTTEKDLVKDVDALAGLGFRITLHDKMPDVVLYDAEKDWLFFVEAVTSVGPMSPKRVIELKQMTKSVTAGIVYVTAFPDFKTFKKFAGEIAWETEIWIAEMPEHMIHMNGDRFIGPR